MNRRKITMITALVLVVIMTGCSKTQRDTGENIPDTPAASESFIQEEHSEPEEKAMTEGVPDPVSSTGFCHIGSPDLGGQSFGAGIP